MILFITGIILLLIYISLLLYYRSAWNEIPIYQPLVKTENTVFISVIIPARNEAKNLPALLNSLKCQTYAASLFEIIIVDDHSTDDTNAVVKNFPLQNISMISLSEFTTPGFNSYKKKAIEVAIQQAQGTLMVTTDADCTVPERWLQTIAAFYEEKKPSFIVMPVVVECNNNFLEMFQALDFMTLQGITGASVHKKMHSMCNGANLAYTKKVFQEVGGFEGIDTIASGDDMLLMHKIYKHAPSTVYYLKCDKVIVSTQPMHHLKDFLNQRIRWASKADKYEDKRIFTVLLMVYFFNAILLILPVIAIFHNYKSSIAGYTFSILSFWIALLVLKTIVELIFLFPVAAFFAKQRLLVLFPLFQPFHIVYTLLAGALGKFGRYSWKGRIVK